MRFHAVLALALLAPSCTGDEENPVSGPADPGVVFPTAAPDVLTGWPCPPFDIETDEGSLGDSDGDGLTDCQEVALGSDPNNTDSDGDLVADGFEIDEMAPSCIDPEDSDWPRPCLDTDSDDVIDLLDPDDDDDGVPTRDEDLVVNGGDGDGDPRNDDYDLDGDPNYRDEDDDDDRLKGLEEDTNGDGDPTNDDLDGDGIVNRLDTDDDGDGAPTADENVNNDLTSNNDDTDADGIPDWQDLDDDGDGILTADEDWDGSGSILDDNLDGDLLFDFHDLDDDADTVPSVTEGVDVDTDGDGTMNFRDEDDDGDGVPTKEEDFELYSDAELPTDTKAEDTQSNNVLDDDTDEDGIPNYLDANDDGDVCWTIDEDTDADLDWGNDDADADGIPDYLDADTAACPNPKGPPADTASLTLDGSGLGVEFEGLMVSGALSDGTVTVATQSGTVVSGSFELTFADVLELGVSYSLDLLVDEDGTCDPSTTTTLPPETEALFRVAPIDLVAAGQDLTVVFDAGSAPQEPAACDSF